ncbi:MAG: homoserine O-acetyltransferase [Lentisphaeraceae bacterium]|nr:homoserine O-acetyltransferase [Lentisphaeraceae bacterium]
MIVEPQTFSFGYDDDEGLTLCCGSVLKNIDVGYETYGNLNKDASNAILVCHALTGSAHAAGKNSEDDKKPGWWDSLIGPGKPFDTDSYFIVCSNILGSCYGTTGPSSINPATGEAYNLDFPVITVSDMVNTQYRLMKHLKIDKWLSVAGGSLGGMQALQWAVSYPDCVHSVMPIATTSMLSPQSIAFDWVGREAIMSDKEFNDGKYTKDKLPERGLAISRMLAHITYLSESGMREKFGRRLQEMDEYNFGFSYNFQVESYLKYQGTQFVNRFDANSYLYITRAMDYFNLSTEFDADGDLAKVLDRAKANFLIVSFSSDWLFPPYQSVEIVKALQKCRREVNYCEIQSDYGHDAFLLEDDTLGNIIRNFLASQKEVYSK